jgi:hypothetical protein
LRVVPVAATPQPDLPEFDVEVKVDGELVTQEFEWPVQTRQWWRMLASHPLLPEFTDMDWSYLLDTARLHASFWMGRLDLASELRLREAKYGFTPDDRLRLRISYAEATGAELDTADRVKRVSARDRAQGIRRLEA